MRRLHDEVGLSHMDASLGNVLANADRTAHALVDFEDLPADGVGLAVQKVYDHLRLIHSSWKFIRPDERAPSDAWLAQLDGRLDPAMRGVGIDRIGAALGNLLNDAAWRQALARLLPRLV